MNATCTDSKKLLYFSPLHFPFQVGVKQYLIFKTLHDKVSEICLNPSYSS